MATIKIVQTNKEDGTEKILDLDVALEKLSGWYSDFEVLKTDLLNGIRLNTAFCYFEKLEDKNANNHN